MAGEPPRRPVVVALCRSNNVWRLCEAGCGGWRPNRTRGVADDGRFAWRGNQIVHAGDRLQPGRADVAGWAWMALDLLSGRGTVALPGGTITHRCPAHPTQAPPALPLYCFCLCT